MPPWFIIPSNHKWFCNLAISTIIAEKLKSLGMKFLEPTVDIDQVK
jgi:polyphosphate kinase 2 (PPK2 family)